MKWEKGMNAEGMKCEKGYEMGKVKRVLTRKRYEKNKKKYDATAERRHGIQD